MSSSLKWFSITWLCASCVLSCAYADTGQTMSSGEFQQWLAGNATAPSTSSSPSGAASSSALPLQPIQAIPTPGAPPSGAPRLGPPQEASSASNRLAPSGGGPPPGSPGSAPKMMMVPPMPMFTYDQGQKSMLETLPKGPFPPTRESNAAFSTMLQQNVPLSPQQVVQLRQMVDLSQRAAAVPANVPPKPVSSTIMINLAPGNTPPAVRLAQGYVTSLVFVDSTGSPWPISAFDVGNPKAINLQWDGKSNILFLQAISPYSDGDIVVRLAGLPTPVTLELVSGQRVVDFRADIHVPGIGPNTKELPVGSNLPDSANQVLLGVLDGVAPPGSRLLTVRGADCQAWLLGERMYLRTRLTVLSPGWTGSMTSPDGMQAYELPKTTSVLISRFGEPAEIKVEGF